MYACWNSQCMWVEPSLKDAHMWVKLYSFAIAATLTLRKSIAVTMSNASSVFCKSPRGGHYPLWAFYTMSDEMYTRKHEMGYLPFLIKVNSTLVADYSVGLQFTTRRIWPKQARTCVLCDYKMWTLQWFLCSSAQKGFQIFGWKLNFIQNHSVICEKMLAATSVNLK